MSRPRFLARGPITSEATTMTATTTIISAMSVVYPEFIAHSRTPVCQPTVRALACAA
jgi:hypothetical protein